MSIARYKGAKGKADGCAIMHACPTKTQKKLKNARKLTTSLTKRRYETKLESTGVPTEPTMLLLIRRTTRRIKARLLPELSLTRRPTLNNVRRQLRDTGITRGCVCLLHLVGHRAGVVGSQTGEHSRLTTSTVAERNISKALPAQQPTIGMYTTTLQSFKYYALTATL